ncbi:MAG: trypsin-like serine protease [Bacteroidia bacterium]|nr:trypsin-like serine protease [Bacteroidia bacterium]
MNNLKFLFFATAIIALFFCGIIRHDVDEMQYTMLASEKQFNGVGEVLCNNQFNGSCVWIRDRYVLSAAHVFLEYDYKKDTIKMNGRKAVINKPVNRRLISPTKVELVIKGKKHRVRKITMHPTYLDTTSKGACDIAIIELEEPIKDMQAIPVNEKMNELGSSVVGVGYGVFGIADKPNDMGPEKSVSKRIAGQNMIDSIGGDNYQSKPTILFADFDHPTRKDCNKMGSATPLPLEYICSGGDSGGALFRQVNGTWEVIAICSGTPVNVEQLLSTGYYGQIMEWTRLSVFSDWIKANTK